MRRRPNAESGWWSSARMNGQTTPSAPSKRPVTGKELTLSAVRAPFLEAGFELIDQLGDGNPDLLHRVALADGHGSVDVGFEVDRDAEGGADLGLPAGAL